MNTHTKSAGPQQDAPTVCPDFPGLIIPCWILRILVHKFFGARNTVRMKMDGSRFLPHRSAPDATLSV